MITIAIVDSSPDARQILLDRVCAYQMEVGGRSTLTPQLSLKALAPEELRFCAAPDVCILGEEFLKRDSAQIATIRKIVAHSTLFVFLKDFSESLVTIEHLARLGVDDLITESTSGLEFFRKIILNRKKNEHKKKGFLLVVDSGKGGVGVTTVVAALGESALDQKKKVAVVDFDFDTQNLSRFLQARPFVNETFGAILHGEQPLIQETVTQTLVQVWSDEANFFCVPPMPAGYTLGNDGKTIQTFLSYFEHLDELFDLVIVDVASLRGILRDSLYRIADKIVFLVNNDPAALFGSVESINHITSVVGTGDDIVVVENAASNFGLSSKTLSQQFFRATHLTKSVNWFESEIPFCKRGARWPASGATLYGQGSGGVLEAIDSILAHLGIIDEEAALAAKGGAITKALFSKWNRKDQKLLPEPAPSKTNSGESTAAPGSSNSAHPHSVQPEIIITPAVLNKTKSASKSTTVKGVVVKGGKSPSGTDTKEVDEEIRKLISPAQVYG